MNSQSSTFKLKTSGNYDQLISQKQGLTNNAKYLAVTRGASGALMLTTPAKKSQEIPGINENEGQF